jgi:hypothetical protein
MGGAVTAVALAAALAACGGGGGGGVAASGNASAQAVAIDETSAPGVAAEAIDAAGAGLAGNVALTGVEVSASSAPRGSTLLALGNVLRAAAHLRPDAALVGATTSRSIACSGGGSIDAVASVASQDAPSPGDRVDMTFDACIEAGATLAGALSLTIAGGNADGTLIDADLAASNLVATKGAVGERMNGTLHMSVDARNTSASTIDVRSDALSFDRLRNGGVRATRTLSAFTYHATIDSAGATSETFSVAVSGSFPRLGNVSFTAQTTQAIVTPAAASFPSAGAGRVTGANGSNVVVTVVGDGVRLDVVRNGDGVVDASLNRSWAELDADL